MQNRDFYNKQSVKHGSGYHYWRLYQSFRNRVNIEIRKNKSSYFRGKIAECNKINPKNTWKLINSSNDNSNLIKEIKIDEQIISKMIKYQKPLMITSSTLGQN